MSTRPSTCNSWTGSKWSSTDKWDAVIGGRHGDALSVVQILISYCQGYVTGLEFPPASLGVLVATSMSTRLSTCSSWASSKRSSTVKWDAVIGGRHGHALSAVQIRIDGYVTGLLFSPASLGVSVMISMPICLMPFS
jgi:hypothetical protein